MSFIMAFSKEKKDIKEEELVVVFIECDHGHYE